MTTNEYGLLAGIIGVVLLIVAAILINTNDTKTEKKDEYTKPIEEIKLPSLVVVEEIPPEFHIKVAPTTFDWTILFTNDNWITEEEILRVFDISGTTEEVDVVIQRISLEKEKAIELAEDLNTYEKCIEYNKTMQMRYKKMLEFRKANPIPLKAKRKPEKEILIK